MTHLCEFILGAQGSHEDLKVITCDAPASLKRDGFWFCADHFDVVEDNSNLPDPSSNPSKKAFW
jgi:hypothetical protein